MRRHARGEVVHGWGCAAQVRLQDEGACVLQVLAVLGVCPAGRLFSDGEGLAGSTKLPAPSSSWIQLLRTVL